MKKGRLLFLFIFFATVCNGQGNQVDGLLKDLENSKEDTNRVKTLNELANAYNLFLPAKGLITAKEANELATKLNYTDGQLKSFSLMANAYNNIGNYNKAMEIFLTQLTILEKKNNPPRLANVLMNIGILYTQQKEYTKALPYYLKSDSIIKINKISQIAYNSFQNLGDLYDRLNKNDSAFYYYQKAFTLALKINNPYFIGASYIGLGNYHIKEKNIFLGINMFQNALTKLSEANDADLFCESAQNISKAYFEKKQFDSSLMYAHISLKTATKAGFTYRIKDAVEFLSKYYKSMNRFDSALYYNEKMTVIKDSINSADKIKAFQLQSFNEEIRQAELAEKKQKEEAERFQQLQLLFMGIFIPVFFLFTLLLSKRKIHVKAIKALGIISLLLFFEYLTLLLHPVVVEFTNHTPIFELIIFVSIAALLIPTHHRIENWLIQRLTIKHIVTENQEFVFKTSKMKFKKPLQ